MVKIIGRGHAAALVIMVGADISANILSHSGPDARDILRPRRPSTHFACAKILSLAEVQFFSRLWLTRWGRAMGKLTKLYCKIQLELLVERCSQESSRGDRRTCEGAEEEEEKR